jgi:hypothetical protein
MLCQQPRIFMPAMKGTHFFSGESAATPDGAPRTLDGYLALFAEAAPDQLLGEASPSYLRSQSAAASIAALQPAARIIAILREPASFLHSLYLQLLQDHVETVKDFGKAIALEPVRRQGKQIPRDCPRPQALLYSEQVRYAEQLRRYGDVFAPENMLVLIYDDFRTDNEGTVHRVLDFLGVDDVLPTQPREANPTVRLRSTQLDELIHRASVGHGPLMKGVKVGIKAITSRRARRAALGMRRSVVYGQPRQPDERLMRDLRHRFRGEVEALSDYLGRDLLQLWGYDDVASR